MAQIDDIIFNEGMLELSDSNDAYNTRLDQKHTMLCAELSKLSNHDTLDVVPTKIITNILNDISNEIIIQTPGHNMTCHSKSHGSTGSGTGFGKSHDKRC